MSFHRSSHARRATLAVAISFALVTGSVHAQDTPAPFRAYRDGHLVPSAEGEVHHDDGALAADFVAAAQRWCAGQTSYPGCTLITHAEREIAGGTGRHSAYSVLDITLQLTNSQGQVSERLITGDIRLVRSCPVDAVMVTDADTYLENRDRTSSQRAVACVSPDALPKPDALGVPGESGANQCPIGNTPLVGNPINPLTGSKIEHVVDYAGPATSGLIFARTYHSGAFPLAGVSSTAGARYPAGARIGARWRHSFDRAFVRRPHYDDSGNVYTTALYLVHEDGRETRFVKQGDRFVPGEGERGSLREHPEGGWLYTWPDLTEERYDDRGRLRARTDANGNTLTLRYDEITVGIGLKATVLVRVSDRQGRELHLSYDRLGRVETVDTPDGRFNYSYSGDLLEGLDADLVSVGYPDGKRVGYHYDEPAMGGTPNHKLTGIVGKDGQRFASFHYDNDNRARRSSHGDDLAWTEVALSRGKVEVKIKDVMYPQAWTPAYDQGRVRLGERADSPYSDAHVQTFDYLGGGLVARQTDYLGVQTTYRYDTARRLETGRTEAEGTPVARTVTTTWHPLFDKPLRIDNGAQWTVFAYDGKGNLIERREGGVADAGRPDSGPWPEERVTGYTYDPSGRLLTVDGPLAGTDDTTRMAYYDADAPDCATGGACAWRQGDLHTVTDALGHVSTVLAYDAAGRVLASTDANGVRTDRRYDAMGRLEEIALRARRDGAPSAADRITAMTYTANGDLDTVTDPDGAFVTHRYDAARRLIEQVDAKGQQRKLTVNGLGHITEESFVRPDGTADAVRHYAYDYRGFLRSISSPGVGTRNVEYDDNHRLIRVEDQADLFPGEKRVYQRDALGRVEQVEHGYRNLGLNIQTRLTYDGTGQVKTVDDPKRLSTQYLRNGLGDLLWQMSPDTGETHVENDATGQPVHEAPADQRTVERAYDRLGRPTRVTYRDGQSTTYSWDSASPACGPDESFAVGRLTSVSEASGSTVFCYDVAGRVVRKVQTARGVSLTLRYEYTPAGRLLAITYPDGRRMQYKRDVAGDVTGIDMQAPSAAAQPILAEVGHDAAGRVTGWTAGARHIRRSYNRMGNLTGASDGRPDGFDASITYYGFGIVGSVKERDDTLPRQIWIDSASRVTTGGVLDHSAGTVVGERYEYDSTGNRLRWWSIVSGTDRRYVYAPDSHRLLTANHVARDYDAAGNTTRIGEREFVYDATGRMSQAKVNGVVEMNYAYNAFGQQVARYIAGQTTISLHDEAGHWLGDYDGAGQPIRQMVWLDDLPVAALDGDAIRDIQPDHLGTPRVVVDRATDTALWRWRLGGEAFGASPPNEDPDGDGTKYVFDMRFPGQRYDAVTGLFQNGWRDYDPLSGRYIQSDPIGLAGGISTYAYVANNPYMRIDPLGLWAIGFEAFLGIGGGVNVAWQNGTLEFTGKVGVGIGAGLSWDPNGAPSPHAKNCGSGLIARTSFNATLGAGIGPISSQMSYTSATENVFDLSPKRHPGDFGTRGYSAGSMTIFGIDRTPTSKKLGIRFGVSLSAEAGSYSNW